MAESVDLLVVDEKAGKAYANLFRYGKEIGDHILKHSAPDDKTAKACSDLLNRLKFNVLYCEDATVAYLLLPAIVNARPRAALISYTQGSRWGMTPLGVKGILFDDETPSLIRGTDLARELRLAGIKMYIHLVSDIIGASGSNAQIPDFDTMVKSGLIDSYSRRNVLSSQDSAGISAPAENFRNSYLRLSLEPLKILADYLSRAQ